MSGSLQLWRKFNSKALGAYAFCFLCPIVNTFHVSYSFHLLSIFQFFSHSHENISPFLGQFIRIGEVCSHFPCKCLQSCRISFSQIILVYPSMFSIDSFPPAYSSQEYTLNLLILALYLQVRLSRNIGKPLVKLRMEHKKCYL